MTNKDALLYPQCHIDNSAYHSHRIEMTLSLIVVKKTQLSLAWDVESLSYELSCRICCYGTVTLLSNA